ncbi:MAG: RNA polymerase sporulation sigma factor SigK [Acutalibacteraceae bacterium]
MLSFLGLLGSYVWVFILHVTGAGSFPKPLTAQQEQDCLKRLKEGDVNARNELVEHNLRLVAHIIKKYYASSTEQDDLVSIGTIGLIKAINTYDSDKNIKLSSYASRCIENEVLMYFRNLRRNSQSISLDETIDSDKDGNPLTLMDIMSVEDNIIDDLDLKLKTQKLYKYVDEVLDERESAIIKMRYGLCGDKPITQRETAEKLNISRSYVSRIEKRALKQLLKCFNSHP